MAFALLDHTEEKTTINEILTGTFREKDRQINFAIEELEKVKAEIEYLTNYCSFDVYGKKYPVYDKAEVLQILDEHISELKGE